MAYVRWSTPVGKDCPSCKGQHWVPGKGRCAECLSCWYVYRHVDGFIALHHAGCSGPAPDCSHALEFETAASWQPSPDCPNRDVALQAVADALRAWESERPQ